MQRAVAIFTVPVSVQQQHVGRAAAGNLPYQIRSAAVADGQGVRLDFPLGQGGFQRGGENADMRLEYVYGGRCRQAVDGVAGSDGGGIRPNGGVNVAGVLAVACGAIAERPGVTDAASHAALTDFDVINEPAKIFIGNVVNGVEAETEQNIIPQVGGEVECELIPDVFLVSFP